MILLYVDSPEGQLKKSAFEAMTYAHALAKAFNTEVHALTLGTVSDAGQLGVYGATKVYNVAAVNPSDSQAAAAAIGDTAKQLGADVVVVMHTANGKAVAGRLAIRLTAGVVTNVNSLPTLIDGAFRIHKNVFSGKAIAEYEIKTPIRILTLAGNTMQPIAVGTAVAVESLTFTLPASRITVKEVNRVVGKTPLPEAELVVSAGRGMKGPENWGIIEELADAIGATTACSRPVADIHWRPHYEHVGQTGVAIRPNLYIAVGISGAIQHLAGVNQSKVIVVINKDPEAPFFKAADYGIVGDLFDIVPKITAAIKAMKA